MHKWQTYTTLSPSDSVVQRSVKYVQKLASLNQNKTAWKYSDIR